MVENTEFAVGISTLYTCRSSRDISISGFDGRFRLSIIIGIIQGHYELAVVEIREPQVSRWNFDDICHTFGDISTSGLGGHIAISSCPSMSNLFMDTFFEFAVVENYAFQLELQ